MLGVKKISYARKIITVPMCPGRKHYAWAKHKMKNRHLQRKLMKRREEKRREEKRMKKKHTTSLTQFFHIVIKIFTGDKFPGSHKSVTHRVGFVRQWSWREAAVTEALGGSQGNFVPDSDLFCLLLKMSSPCNSQNGPMGAAVPGQDNVHLVQGSRICTKALGDACLSFLHW